jgi:hypothetical protein
MEEKVNSDLYHYKSQLVWIDMVFHAIDNEHHKAVVQQMNLVFLLL